MPEYVTNVKDLPKRYENNRIDDTDSARALSEKHSPKPGLKKRKRKKKKPTVSTSTSLRQAFTAGSTSQRSGDGRVKGTSRQPTDNEQRLSGGEVQREKDDAGCGPCAPSLLIHGELALFADAASSRVLTPPSITRVARDKTAPPGRRNYSAQLPIEKV